MGELPKPSLFTDANDLVPRIPRRGATITELVNMMAETCFEARNLAAGARLFERMIREKDTIWLGIAGAGVAGGLGGQLIALMEAGFVDAVCSTGAQVYHDLHFAFELPVKKIHPRADDDLLREHGDTRIYDIGVRDQETLCAQDELIRSFLSDCREELTSGPMTSQRFNYLLGQWVGTRAGRPELSFVVAAARLDVPVFWDSLANHSIGMNLLGAEQDGLRVSLSAQQDIWESAAIVYGAKRTGSVQLGGGGPKNFIQQTGPVLKHMLGLDYEGAERGLQVGTAVERDGSLSGCSLSESVTWGKYRAADPRNLVQIWAEYSIVLPLLTAYVLDCCSPRLPSRLVSHLPQLDENLQAACERSRTDVS
jgi:deoxyhypusine synthase